MNNVFFVSPLPPPVHGFSWVNAQIYGLLEKKCRVIHFDRTPSSKGLAFTLFRFISNLFFFLFKLLTSRPSMVYIGWSGGRSMLIDFGYICLCRLFFVPVCLHHHSFAYLNNIRWFNRLALLPTRNQFHVVLCQSMADLLVKNYDVVSKNVTVVSNAAFLPPSVPTDYFFQNKLAVGFLSNVTEAKGIFEFFDLAKHFSKNDLFHFYVAGPVDSDLLEQFNTEILKSTNVTYIGAVYSKDKDRFFKSLDVFVFPTKYINEAEPVTISEAMRAGLPIISIQRGCIASMLNDSGVVTQPEKFLEESSVFLNRMISDRKYYSIQRSKSTERFDLLRSGSLQNLELLIDHLSGRAA